MTSLEDTKHIFIDLFTGHRILQLAKTTRGEQTVHVRWDYKVTTLRINRINFQLQGQQDAKRDHFVDSYHAFILANFIA